MVTSALKRMWQRGITGSKRSGEPGEFPRHSSAPFVSGDTFRAMAEVLRENTQRVVRECLGTGVVFTSDVDSLTSSSLLGDLEQLRGVAPQRATHLVIHNTDHETTPDHVSHLAGLVDGVYAVNALVETDFLRALPIGLENAHHKRNGRLNYYLDALDNPFSSERRTRAALSSFHIDTNPVVRQRAAEAMRASRHGHEDSFRKSLDYRLEVQATKFVISPPGNGHDCHRTWEALYLGAVPVVLRGHLAESFINELPILAVDSYEDFCQRDDNELDELYHALRSRSMDMAWAHYWYREILG